MVLQVSFQLEFLLPDTRSLCREGEWTRGQDIRRVKDRLTSVSHGFQPEFCHCAACDLRPSLIFGSVSSVYWEAPKGYKILCVVQEQV